jgi:predicted nucleic acid-binding protein
LSFLLDTNVLSELRRDPPAAAVAGWAAAQDTDLLFLSVITVLELEIGMLRLARRDRPQAAILREWIAGHVMVAFHGRILPVDAAVARRCAALHVPDPKPERDAMIAATALVHGLTVVTRNTADFARMGVRLLNPWLPAAQ